MFRCVHGGRSDRGVIGLDGVVALGIAAVAAVGLLAAATSMTAQARRAVGRDRVRSIAEQVAAGATSAGCGLAVGTEDPVWVASQSARCATSTGASDVTISGDTTFVVDRDGILHDVTVTARWRRNADGAPEASSCAVAAANAPVTLERTVSVRRASGDGEPYVVVTAEAVPPATVAHTAAPGVVVRGLAVGDQIDLVVGDPGSQVRIRRTAGPLAAGDACAWFPFVADTTVALARAGTTTTMTVTVLGELVVVDGAGLP